MSFAEDLKIERYKLVTDRQKYFTNLARESFAGFMRTFTGFGSGAIALMSVEKRLALTLLAVVSLLWAIAALVTVLGIISGGQIVFCLARWYGFRRAECDINPSCPKPEWWAWIFEGMYCIAIGLSVGVIWWGREFFSALLEKP